jgi:hypothetical protein
MILCEARGLWLFSVIRGGIGLSRRLGAGLQHTECVNERLDTLPRTGASQEPIAYRRGMKNLGRSPGFYSMLKLLASSVVRRHDSFELPPWWESSFVSTLGFPSKVKCHSPADLPMLSCGSFPLGTLLQLLPSAAVAERSPAQRSAAEAALHPASAF